jgi:hypothetical protein
MTNGKLNDRTFSVLASSQGFAEFISGAAEDAFVTENPSEGDATAALDFLSTFVGEFVKAGVNPPMAAVDMHWVETRNGKKYSVIPCEAIPVLLKAGYKATLWANFYRGRVPFLNLAFKKDTPKAGPTKASNKFAPGKAATKPARKSKFAPK